MFLDAFESRANNAKGQFYFWLARDIQHLLGYEFWEDFLQIVSKAEKICELSGCEISDHFIPTGSTVKLGSGSQGKVDDIMLTRYACYLIAQNGDPRKQEIAFAQTYFAIQTRRAELIEQLILETERVSAEKKLSAIILKAKDFATEITIFNSRENRLATEAAISSEHITNNEAVRATLLERGIRPESLPPAEDVKKVERRLTSDRKKYLKNPETLDVN
ncbi:MAG: BRO family protein [Hormoscilla sp.]